MLGVQVFWVVKLNDRVVDFVGFDAMYSMRPLGVAVSWNSTLKLKTVGFLFKTPVIINPASHLNNTQDVNLQATKLHDLKSQKAVILTLISLGCKLYLMRSAINLERNFLKTFNGFLYLRH
jgi:hypothetical protein